MYVYLVYCNGSMVHVCNTERSARLMVRHIKKLARVQKFKAKCYALSWPVWSEDAVKELSKLFDYENNSAITKRKK